MKRIKNQSFHPILNIFISILLVISLIIFSPLNLILFEQSSAKSIWFETKDSDFYTGTFNDTKIIGDNLTGGLVINRSDEWNWIDKRWSWNSPNLRDTHSLAHIYGTNKVLLFGGWDGHAWLNDTWIYDSIIGNWTKKHPMNSPDPRHVHSLAPVYGTDKVLLFGGWNVFSWLNDTWVYDLSDNNWTNVTPANNNPSARYNHVMSSVLSDDKVILFGGWDGIKFNNDTWIYDLSDKNWTEKMPVTSPDGREAHSITRLDGANEYLLFGGRSSSSFSDTWIFNLSINNWIQKSPVTSPSKRYSHKMESIFGTDKIILFGGSGNNNETWEYDLSEDNWTKKHPDFSPSGRKDHAMSSFYSSDGIILFGGSIDGEETWLYNYSKDNWTRKLLITRPSPRYDHSITSVSGQKKVVLFGGIGVGRSNETWIYDLISDNWTKKKPLNKPTARSGHSMVPIYNTNKVLLFGGNDGNSKNDTWIFDLSNNSWFNYNSNTEPGPRRGHVMVSMNSLGRIVLFGGYDSTYNNETWVYDYNNNTWTKKNPQISPRARYGHSMATIDGTDKILLFGGNDGASDNETWIYDFSDNTWTNKSPKQHPGGRTGHSMVSINGTKKVMLFGGLDLINNDETWEYDLRFNSWTQIELILKPSPRYLFGLTTLNGTNKTLLFGGFDWTNDDETWMFTHNSFYPEEGTYISKAYDIGQYSKLLKLYWDSTGSINTSVKFQLRTGLSKSELTSKDFLGPDGKNSTYYTMPSLDIWSGHMGDIWVQYKAILNTQNRNETPRLNNVSIIYNQLPLNILISPLDDSILSINKPEFSWQFTDNDSNNQSSFQIVIDDDNQFNSIDYDSGEIKTLIRKWQFPEGTSYDKISDGTWYWRMRVKDTDGDWGPYGDTFKFVLDTKSPKSSISSPISNRFYNSLNFITGTAWDISGGTGVDRVEIVIECLNNNTYWDGSGWVDTVIWLLTSGTETWTFDTSKVDWASGSNYELNSRAIDEAINIGISEISIIINYDSEAPKSNIQVPKNNIILSTLDVISGTAIDFGGAGINGVNISIQKTSNNKYWNGSSWSSTITRLRTNGTSDWEFDTNNIVWGSGELYKIESIAFDHLNNIESPENSTYFTIDFNKPTSKINYPKNNVYLNELLEITGTAQDVGGSNLDRVELSIRQEYDNKYWDGSAWISQESWLSVIGTSNWYFNSSLVDWTSGYEYLLKSRAIDEANNIEESVSKIEFGFDINEPATKILTPEDNSFINSVNTITGTATDSGGAGLDRIELTIKSLENEKYWDGNKWNSNEVWLLASGTEDWVYYQEIKWVSDVKYQITSRAKDYANNFEQQLSSIDFTFDNKPPEDLVITINNGSMYTNSFSIYLSLNSKDTGSGLFNMAFSFDKIKWTSWELFKTTKTIELSDGTDGERLVYFMVQDYANNVAEFVHDSIILDTTTPHSLSISINEGAIETNSTNVTLTLNAIDNSSTITLMTFSNDGHVWDPWENYSTIKLYKLPLGDGEKVVYFKVKDEADNEGIPVEASIILNTTKSDEIEKEPPIEKKHEQDQSWIYIVFLIIIIVIIFFIFIMKMKKTQINEKEPDNETGRPIKSVKKGSGNQIIKEKKIKKKKLESNRAVAQKIIIKKVKK